MRIRLKSGIEIEGSTAEQVVEFLLNSAKAFHVDERDYMEQVAERVQLWRGSVVDPTTARTFLASLEAAGLLTIENH